MRHYTTLDRGPREGYDPPTRPAIKGFKSSRLGRDELVTSFTETTEQYGEHN